MLRLQQKQIEAIKVKYIFYMFGISILTLGISLTIQSELGTSPFDALLVGMAKNIGLTVGSWEIIISSLLIGCDSLLKRDKPEILGLLTAFVTGVGIDMWLFLFHNMITPNLWFSQAICFGIGLIVIGLGTAMYLQTNFVPIPIDRLTLTLQELTKTSLFFSRTFIYLVFLILALALNGPIGIGTVLTVCFGGLILDWFMPLTKKLFNGTLTQPITTSKDDKR